MQLSLSASYDVVVSSRVSVFESVKSYSCVVESVLIQSCLSKCFMHLVISGRVFYGHSYLWKSASCNIYVSKGVFMSARLSYGQNSP